jgi:adenosylcobinamide-GDP ribazoletransferase
MMRARLTEAQLALMLLTRLPAGQLRVVPPIGAASWAFPLVGALVGGLSATVMLAALWAGVAPSLAAGLALAAGAMATGGLHEDGLADVADGFGGGRDRARKLEIMRDSRIGSYGALALVLAFGLRWQGLALLAAADAHFAAMALVGLGVASRSGLAAALWLMPAARADGMGKAAADADAVRAVIAAGLGALALLWLGQAWAILAIALVLIGFGRIALRQIGGQSGDVLGAMQQLAEIAGWVVLSASL